MSTTLSAATSKSASAVSASAVPAPKQTALATEPLQVLGSISHRRWMPLTDEVSKENSEDQISITAFSDSLVEFMGAQNLLVLAGCGTSAAPSVGGPSMAKLWAEVSTLVGFRDICALVGHSEDKQDVEELLSRCLSAISINDKSKAAPIAAFVKDSESAILRLCTDFLPKADLSAHREFVRRLAHRPASRPRSRIFTTNYDRCFEEAASSLGFIIVDGFSYSLPRVYAPSNFTLDFVRRESRLQNTPEYADHVFHLVKLHGSVDWDRMSDGSVVQTKDPSHPCLVYPASSKYQMSYTQPHLEMMAQFLMALREPNTALVIVGFGLKDEHLTMPIRAAIENNSGLRLLVVDPTAKSLVADATTLHHLLKQRIEQLDDRITILNVTFDQFVHLIPNLYRSTQDEKLAQITKLLARKL